MAEATGSSTANTGDVDAAPKSGAARPVTPKEQMAPLEASQSMFLLSDVTELATLLTDLAPHKPVHATRVLARQVKFEEELAAAEAARDLPSPTASCTWDPAVRKWWRCLFTPPPLPLLPVFTFAAQPKEEALTPSVAAAHRTGMAAPSSVSEDMAPSLDSAGAAGIFELGDAPSAATY
ncbi:dof zinc finger protein 4-like [Miscanthus floridulus]|uniref:dof zinc finger protein 4-like n=1 Tax=Miscanthus floridulus TaxID=154761 RepID=UPI0034582C2B